MALNISSTRKTVIDGMTYTNEVAVSAEVAAKFDKVLGAAKTGTLTTRTDNTTGTLTMSAGHGIATGNRLDIYWAGGRRYGVTVGTVSGNSVPFSLGAGDNLPIATTEITAMVPASESFSATGNDVAAIGVNTNTSEGVMVVFTDGSDVEKHKAEPTVGADHIWTDQDGTTSPVAGDTIAKVFVSHGDSTGSKRVRGIMAYN